MKKVIFLISILLLSACNLNEPQSEEETLGLIEVNQEKFICGRDKVADVNGNEYKTVYFDVEGGYDVSKEGQCWMAENLNVGTKILQPGEAPSDNGEIEKWCMTDDWSAEFIAECDLGEGGEPRSDICQERYERKRNQKQKSNELYCSGSVFVIKHGGLYSWQEIMNYDLSDNQGICPDGWDIPDSDDWEALKNNIRLQVDISQNTKELLNRKVCELEYIQEYGDNDCKKSMPIAEVIKLGEFNGERVGTFIYGDGRNYFADKGQVVRYFSKAKEHISNTDMVELDFRGLYSHGKDRNFFEGTMAAFPVVREKNKIDRGTFSVRCIKREEI